MTKKVSQKKLEKEIVDSMVSKYNLQLLNREDLNRIINFFTKHTEIIEILNEDSKRSISGGATVCYDVEIRLKEIWG